MFIFLVSRLFQLVELSKAQDIEAGDGTTSVVVVAGSLLEASEKLLQRGIHPTIISDAFQHAASKSVEILAGMSQPIELTDKESLIKSASTALNSKVQIIISHRHKYHLFSVS
jgi:T-complex protein 1 subunit delta